MKTCTITGCAKPFLARGMCRMHYERWRRHGDAQAGGTPKGPRVVNSPQRFFLDVVLPHGTDECLIWPFARYQNGHAQIRWKGKLERVSRLACATEWGPPPFPGADAAHSCGKGHEGCVARKHLRWASRLENVHDKVAHGTQLRGEQIYLHVLSEQDVREIRALRGMVTQLELAARYRVHQVTISEIQLRKTWRHVE